MERKFSFKYLTLLFFPLLFCTCSKELSYEGGNTNTLLMTGNNWAFKINDSLYSGCIDTAYYLISNDQKNLSIKGSNPYGDALNVLLKISGSGISNGLYTTANGTLVASFTSSNGVTYNTSDAGTYFSLTVSSHTDTSFYGGFTANLSDPSTHKVMPVTNGVLGVLIGKHNTCGEVYDTAHKNTKAVYTLVPSDTSCSQSTQRGTYLYNQSLNDSNTVELVVDVTQTGSYSITTAATGGMTFSAAGYFVLPGKQVVTLTGSGTPNQAGVITIPVTAGNTNCSFPVNVNAPYIDPTHTWKFTEGNTTYSGLIQFASIGGDASTGASLQLNGFTGSSIISDTAISIYIQLPAGSTQPVPGTYSTNPDASSSNTSFFQLYKKGDNPHNIYYVKNWAGAGSDVIMNIIINTYDASTKVITGSFSGKSWNASTREVAISNGSFECSIK